MKNNIDDSVNLCSPSLSVSESGNEELCYELSPDVDGVSGAPYTSSKLQTDGQPDVGRGLPSIDDSAYCMYKNKKKGAKKCLKKRKHTKTICWSGIW